VCWTGALFVVLCNGQIAGQCARERCSAGVRPRARLLVIAAVQVAQLADHAGVDEAVGRYEVV